MSRHMIKIGIVKNKAYKDKFWKECEINGIFCLADRNMK